LTVVATVTLRQSAIDDADGAFDYLNANAQPGTAAKFVDELSHAFDHIGRHPLTGSLRFAFELDIPDLRTWPLRGFRYLIFYVADDAKADVWRILHAHRDIPASLVGDQFGPGQ